MRGLQGSQAREEVRKIRIYTLYRLDEHLRPKFVGRFGSRHRMMAAVQGLGLSNWSYDVEEKPDSYNI